jgi:Cu(I)/Ag(I) efflux system membrane fusion protein
MALVPLRSATSSRSGEVEQPHDSMIRLDSAQKSAGNISTSTVEERVILRRVELFGEISCITDKQIDFTWYYGGRIQKTLVDYNTTEIKEGAPLLEVYSDEAIADQRDCLKMLMELRWHAEAEKKIFDAQYGANLERVSLVGMSYEHKNINARLNAMKDRLSRIGMTAEDFQALELRGKIRDTFIISAPEKGALLGALPHVGDRFTMDKVLFRLVPLSEVWFVADVYEQDLSLLQLGQQIAVSSRSQSGEIFPGKLVFIGKEVDPQKRTVKARFLIANPNGHLIPQLSVIGILDVGNKKPQLAVPATAVIDTGSRQLVYVETSPGNYDLRAVKVGTQGEVDGDGSARWVPVLDGLAAGEKVVTSGAFLIDAEAQLQGRPASGGNLSPK